MNCANLRTYGNYLSYQYIYLYYNTGIDIIYFIGM